MNKTMGIIVMVVGIVLLVYGLNAGDSLSSQVSEVVNGAPSNKSIALMVAGTVLTALGALSVFRKG